MRTLAALLLVLACLGAQGREVRIAEPSTGLAFSAMAVNRSAEKVRIQFLREMQDQGRLGCAAYCALIADVWAALLPLVNFQQPEGASPLRLLVVTSDRIDALSFPDGTVVISEVLITRMFLDRDQIAFVLAHEASHVLLQHERQTLTSMMALMPPAVRHTPGDVYTELEFRYFSMGDALSIVFHQTEFEADEVGLQLAAMAGFAPDAQLRFMEHLSGGATTDKLVALHPAASARLIKLRELLPLARRLFEAVSE